MNDLSVEGRQPPTNSLADKDGTANTDIKTSHGEFETEPPYLQDDAEDSSEFLNPAQLDHGVSTLDDFLSDDNGYTFLPDLDPDISHPSATSAGSQMSGVNTGLGLGSKLSLRRPKRNPTMPIPPGLLRNIDVRMASQTTLDTVDSVPLPQVVSLTIPRLRTMINGHTSLQLATIASIQICSQPVGESLRTHTYVIVELARAWRRTVWLRLDRRPRSSGLARIVQSVSKATPDSAHLASSREQLVDDEVEGFSCTPSIPPAQNATLGMMQHVLRVVCEELEHLQGSKLDQWLFCALLQHHLGSVRYEDVSVPGIEGGGSARTVMDRVKNRLRLLRPLGTTNMTISSSPSKLSIPGVLLLNINQFCNNPIFAEDSTRLVSLTRYKDTSGLKHEFIVLEAGSFEANEVWVRVDRAATLEYGPTAGSILSNLPAKDSIRIAKTSTDLVEAGGSKIMATVKFPEKRTIARAPTIRDLVRVISTISSVTPSYNLRKENCYFVASIIQEAFTEMFAGEIEGEPPFWARKYANAATNDIMRRLGHDGSD